MHCVVKNDGEIGERKGVNLPNVEIGFPQSPSATARTSSSA